MNRFDTTVAGLEPDSKDKVLQWVSQVQGLTERQARRTGAVVLDNLARDAQFEDEPYRNFIETLARSATTGSCVADYNTACSRHHKKGPESIIDKTLSLHRLVKKRTVAREIAIQAGWSVSEPEEYYTNLMDQTQTDEGTRQAILSNVSISSPRSDVVWGGFDLNLDDTIDPIAGLTASEAKAVLGLGEEAYPAGDPVVRLRYLPPEEVIRYVPTVADAEWNPYWMPAPAGKGFGWTRHLGEPEGTPGRGEVVHDNGKLDWVVSPRIPDTVPE